MGICIGWSWARREKGRRMLTSSASWAANLSFGLQRKSGVAAPQSKLIVLMVHLGDGWIFRFGGLLLLLKPDDFVVLIVGQDANQRHHTHHLGGPVRGQAVRFGLGDYRIHAHLHEGVLREALCAFGVGRDR